MTTGKLDTPGLYTKGNTVNILLVGAETFDWAGLRKALNAIGGIACIDDECTDIEEAIDFFAGADRGVSMVFLDLSVFNNDYPKELFLKLRKFIPSTPIVVLTDRTDYDLIHFVMKAGAAETFSLWQLASDEDRLKNIVESCQARDRIAARQHQLMIREMDAAEQRYFNAQEETETDNASALEKVVSTHTDALRQLGRDNNRLRDERDAAYADRALTGLPRKYPDTTPP